MVGKSVYLLAFLVSIVAIASAETSAFNDLYAAKPNKSNNLIVGSHLYGDRLVLRQNVIKKSSWMQIVTLQQKFTVSGYERITLVEALDQRTNGNGATVTLFKGGPGQNNVELRFKSQRGHGINFVVNIYARR